jgi:hypothetical protein
MLCGGYAYFSTISEWTCPSEIGREIRKPSCCTVDTVANWLEELGHPAHVIQTEADYEHWTLRRGWAFVPDAIARGMMQQWLNDRECIKDALGTYTDVMLASPGTLKHIASRGRRRSVIERDRGRCLLCGRTEADGVTLTVHHVRAHSRGGETTARNLICLCAPCNQSLGTEKLDELYELAGLPHGIDIGLMKGEFTDTAFTAALKLSDNLMHTRCEIF